MSNSSDGWSDGRRGSRAAPRAPEPETRAERRYPVDGRRPPAPESWQETWHDQAAEDAWRQEQGYLPDDTAAGADLSALNPRTGPPSFDFQPSPLQPRGGRPAGTAPLPPLPPPPLPSGTRASPAQARLPQRPDDLLDDAPPSREADGGDFGALQPDAVSPRPSKRRGADRTVLTAPSRTQRTHRETAHAPIVPAGSVTGRSLTLVIGIMCFLACLTAGAVYLMNQSANAWLRDIASEITVQVEAREKVDVEREVTEIAGFLSSQPGVAAARPLSLETSVGLLEPWLGQTDALKNLPVPRLIAVEIDRANPPDLDALRKTLGSHFKGTALDDHRHWQRQIRTITRSFALGGLAILMLVGAATTAIIVSATRSALASNREIVEVLHFVGATDRFIAAQFQRHFLKLGVRAGVLGAGLAGIVFVAIPLVMELLGGGSASVAELQQLVGSGALDVIGYCWLGAVVLVVAGLCMFTSRIGVYRILHIQH